MFNDAFWGQSFYDQNKSNEINIDIYRNEKLLYKTKGIINSSEGAILNPSSDIDIKEKDVLKSKYHTLIVTFIAIAGNKDTIWNLQTENYNSYMLKHEKQKPSVVNNVNSDQFMQNVGDYGNITLKQQNSYSINDLYDYIAEVSPEDKGKLASLAETMKSETSKEKSPKKGFLNKFDSLIEKYPNISKIISGLLVQWATK